MIIRFEDVWEEFTLPGKRTTSLKQGILDFLTGKRKKADLFAALKGVSFTLNRGEVVGFIGENGSGKSTALNLIAGIYQPDRGSVTVKGKVSALLELGTGFHPELTGRENIHLTGSLLGLNQQQIHDRFSAIEDFAEIGSFIDVPIKTYSSGMYVRLAFALAISVDADILLIDEVLSVGDISFQQKCYRKILDFKEQGKTIIYVSHDMGSVKNLCERVILFQNGTIVRDDATKKSMDYYFQTLGQNSGIKEITGKTYSLLFNNGRFSLFINGELVTINNGLFTTFFWKEEEIPSYSGYWTVLDDSPGVTVFEGRWDLLSMKTVWTIEYGESQFFMNIEIYLAERKISPYLSMKLFLDTSFSSWKDVFYSYPFPPLEPEDPPLLVISQNLENTSYLELATEDEDKVVMINKEVNFNRGRTFLINNNEDDSSRLIKYDDPCNFEPLHDRRYKFKATHRFQLSVNAPKEVSIAKRAKRLDEISLSSNDICLLFTGRQFHLFWKKECLTSVLGIYTSVNCDNLWHDSAQATWDFQRINDSLIGTATFKKIPITQFWKFTFVAPDTLELDIDWQLQKTLPFRRLQANVMLSEHYNSWKNNKGRKGGFPDNFIDDYGGDWEILTSSTAVNNRITMEPSEKKKSYPAISLELLKPKRGFQANIVNSDSHFRSRLLQVLHVPKAGEDYIEAGRHHYCLCNILFTENTPGK